MSRADFYSQLLFPRLKLLPGVIRDAAMLGAVLLLPRLSQLDPKFKRRLAELEFLPSAQGGLSLKRPDQMYDPEVPDLGQLLPSCRFPEGLFRHCQVLASLRSLGLKRTLDWSALVEIAAEVHSERRSDATAAAARGRALLLFMDANASRWDKGQKKKCGIKDELSSRASPHLQAKEEEQARMTCLSRLMSLDWVPSLSQLMCPPCRLLPVPAASGKVCVASPAKAGPESIMWLSSHCRYTTQVEIHSEKLIRALGWEQPVEPVTVAKQVRVDLSGLECKCNVSTAARLSELGKSTAEEAESYRQTLAGVVPTLYQHLSNAGQSHRIRCSSIAERLRKALHESPWLWMGDRFVTASQVAFTSPANARPYLYAVPPDLACFSMLLKTFGVRPAFSSSDFCSVLKTMAAETQNHSLTTQQVGAERRGCSTSHGSPSSIFSFREALVFALVLIELAVAMVQVLSDESFRVSDWEVYVPNEEGALALASELLYNDAPWLGKGLPGQQEFDFGIKSESFGQQESLTRRLRSILEMYPEGPSILSELVQNADDAGATTVRIILSYKRHGQSSLLGPKMAQLQGPSLYVYNDAVFSDRDFRNIAKIGQGSKLEKLATTGRRFGLGFNAVYHYTDTPSWVSGDHLVMLDPHASFLPGATSQQPGIKVKFASSQLLEQFPDQFEPFLLCGCDLKTRFEGTLFRFPLRSPALARESEISHASYVDEKYEIINSLLCCSQVAPRFLLFLRNVQKIEVYTLEEDEREHPSDEGEQVIASSESNNQWGDIPRFIEGGKAGSVLSKDAFYTRLQQRPQSKLPKVGQVVTLTFTEAVGENESNTANTVDKYLVSQHDMICPVKHGLDDEPWILCFCMFSLILAHMPGQPQARLRYVPWIGKQRLQVSVFISIFCQVHAGLGGGAATAMACDQRHRHHKFIPWGGVAGAVEILMCPPDSLHLAGNAFCFLPLPVTTGLPVHINGYFELSSNRRDIWANTGKELAGDGRLRSEWNHCLLVDVIMPIYAALLLEAAKLLGPQQVLSLLPSSSSMSAPWDSMVSSLMESIKQLPIMFSQANGGGWVPPLHCIAMAEDASAAGVSSATDQEQEQEQLYKVLLSEGLLVVRLPPKLMDCMMGYKCFKGEPT
ncbi:unnamed protein product, partial [Chrysoparadoxa australica]